MSVITNSLLSDAAALASNSINNETASGGSGDKVLTYVFKPTELGVSARNPPPTARVTEEQVEKALFEHFGLNVDNAADRARVQELLKTQDSPFNAVKTSGVLTATYNSKTRNYEIRGSVDGQLYEQLRGKAAAVKQQIETKNTAQPAAATANPIELIATKTGDNIGQQRAGLEAKLPTMSAANAKTAATIDPLSAKHGITPEIMVASKEALSDVLDEAGKTLTGAAAAYLEDQFGMTPEFYRYWGLPAPNETNQNVAGRAIGHTISAVQAAAEIAEGGAMIIGGGAEALITSPAAATGVGAIVPAVGVGAMATGSVLVTHGALTGANTINNIINDPILNQNTNQTSGTSAKYDPQTRTDAELQTDLDATPRAGETAADAQRRVEYATGEIEMRRVDKVYDELGENAPKIDMDLNDARNNRAHTIDRHGDNIQMPRDPSNKTVEGRIHGDAPWPNEANFSYKWKDKTTMNNTVNDYLEKNWDTVRSDLATKGIHEAKFDAGKAVGEGYYNKGQMGTGLRQAVYHQTSNVKVTIELVPNSSPAEPFIVRAFPNGSGK